MKKPLLIFGLIIGALLTTNSLIMINMMYSNPEFKGNPVLGYSILIIIFSLMYFGVKNYRNNHLDGKINFLKAFKAGAIISFIASTVYVVIGLTNYYLFIPDFLDVFSNHVIRNAEPYKVEAVTAQMENFKEMYKNPLFAIFVSYMEVLPIGIVVALLTSFIVKKK